MALFNLTKCWVYPFQTITALFPSSNLRCKGRSAPKYKRWIDICPVGADPQANTPEWSRTGPIIMPSIEDARAHVERKKSPFTQVIAATELPEAELPPEGVERWYLVGR